MWAAGRLAAEETAGQRAESAVRLRAWLLATATAAGRLFEPDPGPEAVAPAAGVGFPDQPAAERWLRLEEPNWVHALGEAAVLGEHAIVVEVAESMHWFSDRWSTWPSWVAVFGWSSAAAHGLGDAGLESVHRNYLAWALLMQRRHAEAFASAELAGALARAAGDVAQEAW